MTSSGQSAEKSFQSNSTEGSPLLSMTTLPEASLRGFMSLWHILSTGKETQQVSFGVLPKRRFDEQLTSNDRKNRLHIGINQIIHAQSKLVEILPVHQQKPV